MLLDCKDVLLELHSFYLFIITQKIIIIRKRLKIWILLNIVQLKLNFHLPRELLVNNSFAFSKLKRILEFE